MVQNEQPVRVIYAKLTATGAYDVVAKTSNIALDRARALAERLLPGNPPLDAVVGDEVAHLRPPEGGHIVLRFSRYDWADGDRGDVFITDIAWFSDDDFRRARNNAFALVPRTDRVFAELTELAPVAAVDQHVQLDLDRIARLREVASDARTIVASTMVAESVLLVHGGSRAGAMELFTLLLPPRLRADLTFQTQAFRVPVVLPRITLVDRGSANLRDAPWKILPSVDVDVPLELAGRFVALADDPGSLALAHELYDEAYDDAADLRTCITRLTRLAALADALRKHSTAQALRLLADADPQVRAIGQRRLRVDADDAALRAAMVQLLREGSDGAWHVLALLRELHEDAASVSITAALADALRAEAPDELRLELAGRAARHGDVARLLALIGDDPRKFSARLNSDALRAPDDVRRLLEAIRDAAGPRADLDAAARLLAEARLASPSLPVPALATLQRIARDAVLDALDRTTASGSAVAGMRRLQDAAAAHASTVGTAISLPPLLGAAELATVDAAGAVRIADDYAEPARVVLGATLLSRAWDAYGAGNEQECLRAGMVAAALLSRAGAAGRELARQVLAERNIHEDELVSMPGADALLNVLGGSAPEAAIARRLTAAIGGLAAGHETALHELTGAVHAAHTRRIRIAPNSELSQRVVSALGELARSQSTRADSAAVEIALELIAIITEPAHIGALENAALGDGMVVRLHRLDRSVAHVRAAEDEDLYERYARAVESADVPIDSAARERLRDALGTRGLKRRLLRAVSSVVERDAS